MGLPTPNNRDEDELFRGLVYVFPDYLPSQSTGLAGPVGHFEGEAGDGGCATPVGGGAYGVGRFYGAIPRVT